MNAEKQISVGELECAAANINYVGKAVSYYMEHELGSPCECSALMDCFVEMIDNYLTNLAQ